MAYHEAYWVVIGTAAPVLGLAHTVSLQRVAERVRSAREAFASGDRVALPLLTVSPTLYAILGFGTSAWALFLSLQALALEEDVRPAGFDSYFGAAPLIFYSLVLLAVVELFVQGVDALDRQRRSRPPE